MDLMYMRGAMEKDTVPEKEIEREKIDAFSVKHLPIIKAYADKIGIVPIINQLIESEMDIDPGTVFLGMILDTLSGRSPLYRLDEFFESQDCELLLGKEVNLSSFSDYNVARVFDKAFDVGTIQIFNEISKNALEVFEISSEHVCFDTTSVNIYGDYDLYVDPDHNQPFEITHGYSKDHRPDLKQFILSLLCVDRTVPIFGKTEDGNSSDKTVNNVVLSDISRYMANYGLEPGAFIYIADSAMVTQKNLLAIGDDILFISRMPATFSHCSKLISEAVEKDQWEDLGILSQTEPTKKRPAASYKTYDTEVIIKGRTYRAIVIHSSAHDKRRQKRIEKQLTAERDMLEKQCKEAVKNPFYCEADATAAGQKLKDQNTTFYNVDFEVEPILKYNRGRPKKDGTKQIKEINYGLCWKITEKEQSIAKLKEEAGCFVLLTNVTHLGEKQYEAYDILRTYKDQYGIEQNFGFLKDPMIVNGVFLKKPQRIEVLGLVLLLSLLIWRLIEKSMRRFVEKDDQDLPGWKRRRTTRPTTFMLMTKFQGVLILKIGAERRFTKPLNSQQLEYLSALKVGPEIFIDPRAG